jgi:undecaprenyl phosphate-alpha-L-ara4N flippase subunit ArnE
MELQGGVSRALPYLGMLVVVTANVTANLMIKQGAIQPASRALFGVITWQTVAGTSCFAASLLFYAWVLRRIPLYAATSISVLQYVGVILGAALLFHEPIFTRQWLGMAVIILGLLLVIA